MLTNDDLLGLLDLGDRCVFALNCKVHITKHWSNKAMNKILTFKHIFASVWLLAHI